jgi:anaerobic selenocysteine-containing dehydrogenase
MVVFMNELDMKEGGIVPGALVEIDSLADDGQRRVVCGFLARPRAIPQGAIGATVQKPSIAPIDPPRCQSKTPAAKSIPARSGRSEEMQRSRREFASWVRAHKREQVGAPLTSASA